MSNSDFLSLGERPSLVLDGEGRVFELAINAGRAWVLGHLRGSLGLAAPPLSQACLGLLFPLPLSL